MSQLYGWRTVVNELVAKQGFERARPAMAPFFQQLGGYDATSPRKPILRFRPIRERFPQVPLPGKEDTK